jgi:hypothetical protein
MAEEGGYDPRDRDIHRFSTTTLIHSPKEYELKKFHWDELTQDVKDFYWMLFGTALHNILEEYSPEDAMLEEKLEIEVDGCVVVAKVDMYHEGVVTDWKSDTTFKADSPKDIYEKQLNIYAWALRKSGYEVTEVQYWSFYKNWSAGKMGIEGHYDNEHFDILTPKRKAFKPEFLARLEKNPAILDSFKYPLAPWRCFSSEATHENTKLRLWSFEEQDEYVRAQVALHKKYASENHTQESIDAIPPCSPDDRWVRGEKWRIKSRKAGRAIRGGVHENEKEAKNHYKALMKSSKVSNKDDLFIEHTPGEDSKCLKYCPAAKYCNYFRQKYLGENS